jgi:hypothetical protein
MTVAHQLSKETLKVINTPSMRRKLMDVLDVTEFTIARYIQKNSLVLTQYAVLELIKQETGLTFEQMLNIPNNKDKQQ